MVKTHILYVQHRFKKEYFSGTYDGLCINFQWSFNRDNATELSTVDAWDILFIARKDWPQYTIEVKRIITLHDLQTRLS